MIEILPNWHPMLVHFTVALMTVAAMCFLLTHLFPGWQRRDELMNAAKWNFWLGSLSAVATILAGWYAFNTVNHDTSSHAAMTMHRNWALVTIAVILLLDVWLWKIQKTRATGISQAFAFVLIIFLGLLGTTAWHGGELVYRYGLGVMSLPTAEDGDGHNHDHGDSHTDSMQHEANKNAFHDDSENMPAKVPMVTPPNEMDKNAVEPITPADNVHLHDDGHTHTH